MVAKLAVVIIAIGMAFGALLVNRQQRIDAVAEVARSQLRMEQHRRTIDRLQAAVAEAVRPSEIEKATQRLAVVWRPIPNRFDPLVSADASNKRARSAANDADPDLASNRPNPSPNRSGGRLGTDRVARSERASGG
ncbi:MAG: hypothetical protein U0572_06900 [Phycisphaerales bacterium]